MFVFVLNITDSKVDWYCLHHHQMTHCRILNRKRVLREIALGKICICLAQYHNC